MSLFTTQTVGRKTILAPPPEKVTTFDVWLCFRNEVDVTTKEKVEDWYLNPGKFGIWDAMIAQGKSYMVGESWTMASYLKHYTSPLSGWQKVAYAYCMENPTKILEVNTKTHHWRVYQRGDYVEFSLPHQDHGGEKAYVSRNGKSKILVNED